MGIGEMKKVGVEEKTIDNGYDLYYSKVPYENRAEEGRGIVVVSPELAKKAYEETSSPIIVVWLELEEKNPLYRYMDQ